MTYSSAYAPFPHRLFQPLLPTGLSRRTGYPLDFDLRVQSFSIRSHKPKQIPAAKTSGIVLPRLSSPFHPFPRS